MTIHPSTFPKRADGTRFVVSAQTLVMAGDQLIAACPRPEQAEMVAAALEYQAMDCETFDAEEVPCKPT